MEKAEKRLGTCSGPCDNGKSGILSVLDTAAPAQTTLLWAGKGRASKPHLVPAQGWTPSRGSLGSKQRLLLLRWGHLECKPLSRQEGPPGALH